MSNDSPNPVVWLAPSDRPALYWRDDVVSHSDLLARAYAVADLFPLAPGGRVVLFAENRPEWIAAFYAVVAKRGIAVPVDALSPADEVAHVLRTVSPAVAVCSAKTLPVLRQAVADAPGVPAPRILSMDDPSFPAALRAPKSATLSPIAAGAPDAPAAILFTSGTTGKPKGVVLTYANMQTNLDSVCRRVPIFTPETRVFALLPLHHILPLMGTVVAPLFVGGVIILAHSLDPADMVAGLQRRKATLLIGVPRLYALLHKAIMENLTRTAPGRFLFALARRAGSLRASRIILAPVHRKFGGCLRQMVSGGAALDRQVARDLADCGFEILEGYGMTECAPMIAFPRPGRVRLGSCGNPCIPDSVRIEAGEICARGPHVTPGYWNDPAETAAALSDGWLHTGDLGYLDSNGYLFITGRKKELLVLPNGKKVNPSELEEKLLPIAGATVRELAVTMRDGLLHLLVVPARGLDNDVPADQAARFRRDLLEPYNRLVPPAKKITRLTVVPSDLPKTRLDKVKRHELPALAIGTRASAEASPETAPAVPPALADAYAALARFIANDLDCPGVAPGSTWDLDLALDSLSRLSLLVFLQNTFGVKWPENIFATHKTVLDLLRATDERKTCFNPGATGWNQILQTPHAPHLPHDLLPNLKNAAAAKLRRDPKPAGPAAPAAAPAESAPAEPPLDLPRSSFLQPLLRDFFAFFLRLLFRVRASGREHIPGGPCIFAPNHQSYIDGLFVSMFIPRPVLRRTCYYAKAKHVRGPLVALARNCNVIVVHEGLDVGDSIRKMALALRQGRNLVIFPEGTRSADGTLGEFRATFARLAAELRVPVIPVALRGTGRALPRGHHFPRLRTRVDVTFLPPLSGTDPALLADETRAALTPYV